MKRRTENCCIYSRGCAEKNYNVSLWRRQFDPQYPSYHYFYDGYEFFSADSDLSTLADPAKAFESYLREYFNENIWKQSQFPSTADVGKCRYYIEKCRSCAQSARRSGCCSESFTRAIHFKIVMDEAAFCSKNADAASPCYSCRVSPLKSTKLSKSHRRNEKFLRTMEISDLRLGGHAVKVYIDYISYRCAIKNEVIQALPFLFGQSKDLTRISKRLAWRISVGLVSGRGPTYISEACAIPLGTVKAWRSREMELSRKSAEIANARALFEHSAEYPIMMYSLGKINACLRLTNYNAPAVTMPRAYTVSEYRSMSRFAAQKVRFPSLSHRSLSHLLLLSYDFFAANAYKYPLQRAILTCFCYAAWEPGRSNRPTFAQFDSFIDQCGIDAQMEVNAVKRCFEDAFHASWDFFPPEFYQSLAAWKQPSDRDIYLSYSLDRHDPMRRWWDSFCGNNAYLYPVSPYGPVSLSTGDYDALARIRTLCAESEYSSKETIVLMTSYNPISLSEHYVCPAEVFFSENDSGTVDFSSVNPNGIPLDLLEKMLRAGLLKRESTQTLQARMSDLDETGHSFS